MYKITIAIPVYNVEKYIEDSLLSALEQTYSNIEFLVIDDKGNDNSINIVNNIKQNHIRGKDIRIIEHQTNKGLGATRNTAIEYAQGDYLFYMDSDDTIEKETIETLVYALSEWSFDVIESSFRILSSDGKTLKQNNLPNDSQIGDFAICKWMKEHQRYYDGYSWNKLYRLDFLKKNNIRCIPDHRNEDVFFSFQIVLNAKSYKTISTTTYNYYMREGSIVHQRINEYYYRQYIEILDARTVVLNNKVSESKEVPQIIYNYYLQHFFEWWILNVLESDFSKQMKLFFYNHFKETVLSLGLKEKDLIGYRYRWLFYLLGHCSQKQYLISASVEKHFYQIIKVLRGKHGIGYIEII